jgi:hypothetical protein
MQEVRRALRVRGGAEDRALVDFQHQTLRFEPGSGAIIPATTVAAPAIARAAAEVPHFSTAKTTREVMRGLAY